MMIARFCGFALAAGLAGASLAQSAAPVEYEARFANAAHHEARISVTWRGIGEAPLVLRMSRSSPGRYALHEFARNVYDLSATDGTGAPLSVTRADPYSWTVDGHDGTVTATYTLYADRADGTYSQIDATHAHLNIPATFLWAEGQDDRPIHVSFEAADPAWRAATQLVPTETPMAFTAPDLQYFMDSPVEFSAFDLREWSVGEGAETYTIRLALHHDGEPEDLDVFAEMAKAIVDEHIALWGEIPAFDHGSYTFIADYLPHVSGDGMEHRNSTILTDEESLYRAEFDQIGTLSHEFFHAWNVERLRPAELEPFDFTRANPTPSLWFAEGFTSYYGPLLIRRADQWDLGEYLSRLSRQLSGVTNAPGRRHASPQEMSLRAPFVDAATAVDPDNFGNTFTSYYSYGAVIGLALDLTLRRDFEGVTLDDYMRLLWETHGRPEIPYTPADLQTALAEVSGDAAFAEDFFDRTIRGSELPDFAPLLAQAGLELRLSEPGEAWLGAVSLDVDGETVRIARNTIGGSPLYGAGLDRGDEIVSLGRFDIESEDDWDAALDRHAPGDTAEIVFIQRGAERRASVEFTERDALEIVPLEDEGGSLTRAQRAFREAWLGAREE